MPHSGVTLLRQEKVDHNDLLQDAVQSMKIVEEGEVKRTNERSDILDGFGV